RPTPIQILNRRARPAAGYHRVHHIGGRQNFLLIPACPTQAKSAGLLTSGFTQILLTPVSGGPPVRAAFRASEKRSRGATHWIIRATPELEASAPAVSDTAFHHRHVTHGAIGNVMRILIARERIHGRPASHTTARLKRAHHTSFQPVQQLSQEQTTYSRNNQSRYPLCEEGTNQRIESGVRHSLGFAAYSVPSIRLSTSDLRHPLADIRPLPSVFPPSVLAFRIPPDESASDSSDARRRSVPAEHRIEPRHPFINRAAPVKPSQTDGRPGPLASTECASSRARIGTRPT